ncbi:hypothetical protein H0H92_003946 [Tricholoma furcatifolium]|nr:hypothetical protein H0H92_003946 [Tricholoma furcatifolium]
MAAAFVGLLAGLYEFPTSSNVSKATSSTTQAKVPHTLLSNLLKDAVLPYNPKRKEAPKGLVIASIRPTKDIVHVFSHIKKTYRPQWVVTEGGNSLPAVKVSVAEPSKPSSRQKDVMWVRLDEVGNINQDLGFCRDALEAIADLNL